MPGNYREAHLRRLAAHVEWEWHCGQVEEFFKEHGHCDLGEHPAGEWLRAQMRLAAEGRLSAGRRERLASLGVPVAARDAPAKAMRGNRRGTRGRKLSAYAEWKRHCGQVEEFFKEHGHCDLGEHPAGEWLRAQMRLAAEGRLSAGRRQRLASLGVPMKTEKKEWRERLQRVREMLVRLHVPRKPGREDWLPEPPDGDLADWLREQRARHMEGLLPPARQRRLRALQLLRVEEPAPERDAGGAAEGGHAARWEARFAELAAYKEEHGDCDVPKRWAPNPALANWVNQQRQNRLAGALSAARGARLDELGFDWSPGRHHVDKRWERNFQELVRFKERHGHTRVPKSWGGPLWNWRHNQRQLRKKNKLSAERIARLDAIGFEWEDAGIPFAKSHEERWERQWEGMFARLIEFQREHGTTHVAAGFKEHARLAAWVQNQRLFKNCGGLRPDRKARLDAIGFLWRAETVDRDARWERRFQQLCEYQREHGHTRTPKVFDRKLWNWRHVQRDCRRKGMLSADRIVRLDAMGFEWEEPGKPFAKSREERWERQWEGMFALLVEFQREHGTAHVAFGRKEHARLAAWARDQRELWKSGGLRPDRQARLDAIGFLWVPGRPELDELWERRYAELAAFKELHGHTRVPKSWDKPLWRWRHNQRQFRKMNKLSAERVARLDAIGFEWEG